MGFMDMIKSPKPKNDVKIRPIITSIFNPDLSERKSMVTAARPPEMNAPKANGRPRMYAPATPGTTEWDNASPISDQPFNIKNDDKNAQTPPTSADTHIAFNIKLYENGSSR